MALKELNTAKRETISDIQNMKIALHECAQKNDMLELQEKVDDKASIESLRKMKEELAANYLTVEGAEKKSDDFEIQLDDVKELLASKAKTNEVWQTFNEVKTVMQRNHEKAALARDTDRDRKSFQK